MRTAYRKVVRDLWRNKGRTALVVLSIATGVMAVGMITASNTLMERQMTASQKASHPANAILHLIAPIDDETVQSIARMPEIVSAIGRVGLGVRWKPSLAAQWQDASLIAIPDYRAQELDILELRSGDWPEHDAVAVEWNHVQPFGVPSVGGTIYFEVNDRPRPMTVGGTLRDPGVAAPPFSGQPAFYVSLETIERMFGTRGFAELRFSLRQYSEEEAERVAATVEQRLKRQGVGVAFRWYQDPARHWAQDILDGIGLVLTVMALAALFLSAILVVNTVNAIIAQQIPQIGIMKTVGGVRRQISQLYLAGVMAYGLSSLLLAIPLGAIAGDAMARWILGIVNVPAAGFGLLASALWIQISSGLLVPLLAALWPVLRGVAITVREALGRYGLGSGRYGSGRLDRIVGRIRALPSLPTLALRNTFRKAGRAALTQGVLVTAGAIFMMVLTTHYSFNETIAEVWEGLGFDVYLIFDRPQRTAEVLPRIEAHPNVAAAEIWIWHFANAHLPGNADRSQDVQVTLQGVPRGGRMFRPTLTAGRDLDEGDGHALLLNQKVAHEMGLTPGDVIELDLGEDRHTTWTIVGLVFDLINEQTTAFVHADTLNLALNRVGRASAFRIRAADNRSQAQVALAEGLRQFFEARGIGVTVARTLAEDREEAEAQFNILTTILMTMTVLMAVVGSIGLSGTLSINVIERRREIGVMRAVGASSLDVAAIFIGEGLLLGVASWVVATPLSVLAGIPFVKAIGDLIQFPAQYQWAFSAFWIWLMIVILLALVASWLPARRATQISVNESLAYE